MNISTEQLKREDLPLLLDWVNRETGGAITAHDLPREIAAAETWFDALPALPDRLDCMVYLYETPIGLAGLTDMDLDRGAGRLYFLLGEVGYNRLRAATYGILQMLDRAFGDFGLREVRAVITTTEPELLAMLPRLGFVPAGTEQVVNSEEFARHRYLF